MFTLNDRQEDEPKDGLREIRMVRKWNVSLPDGEVKDTVIYLQELKKCLLSQG